MVGHGCTGHHGADGQMDAGEGSTDYSPDCSPLHVSALKGFIFFVQERGRIIASQLSGEGGGGLEVGGGGM